MSEQRIDPRRAQKEIDRQARRADAFDAASFTRPDPALMRYYLWIAVCTLIGFPIALLAGWIRYRTLRYQFDDEGVSVSWGLLNTKEVVLTYQRIQDIHVNRNLLQRWLGIASVEIQTASAGAEAEMTIEGVREPESLRDFLYLRMRGARGGMSDTSTARRPPVSASQPPLYADESEVMLLREIRDALREARQALARTNGGDAATQQHPERGA